MDVSEATPGEATASADTLILVPLTDTVAIDLRMPVCSLPRGISRPG